MLTSSFHFRWHKSTTGLEDKDFETPVFDKPEDLFVINRDSTEFSRLKRDRTSKLQDQNIAQKTEVISRFELGESETLHETFQIKFFKSMLGLLFQVLFNF